MEETNIENQIEFPEKYFTILYKLIRKQNEMLLDVIATNEHLSYNSLAKNYLPSHKDLRAFLKDKLNRHPVQEQTSP